MQYRDMAKKKIDFETTTNIGFQFPYTKHAQIPGVRNEGQEP